jgi:hypothetical protein
MAKLQDLSKEEKIQLAKSTFNEIWNYIDRLPSLKAWEKEMMIAVAHASRYFWGLVGEPLNFQRGEWILSHVYTLIGRSETALHHAQQCWDLTEKEKLQDIDLAFAYEGLARAYALSNNEKKAKETFIQAKKAADSIHKKEDQDYFLEELKKGPWFGLQLD